MEKIKSRWRKNYLEGDIINTDEVKDENWDANERNGNNNESDISNLTNNLSNNLDHHHHHHHNNHINHDIDTNDSKTNDATNNTETNTTTSKSNNHHHNNNNNHHHHHHKHHHSSSKHSSAPPPYDPLVENLYLDKKKHENGRSRKEARPMVCDCILTKEERTRGVMGCLDDCLNRMLMIECGPKCALGDHCLNKRFQKSQSSHVEVFKTKKKGWGLRTTTDLPANSFIMEYVGEVIRSKEFRNRVKKYTKQKIKHHYFMALRSDEIIDSTCKGNLTRFINHSCEPNCETQKWTVNGDLRIGFFTTRDLKQGEEITFDYQFQRYGRKAQKCYCDTPSCRGFIGGNERTFSLNGHSSPRQNGDKAHKKYKVVDVSLEDRINALAEEAADGLKTRDQVIALATLAIKAEEVSDRRKLLDIIKATKSEISLRLLVDYHGLEIICVWMRDPQADSDFKVSIIEILERLPIPNKTKVVESNVYRVIERWATEEPNEALHITPSIRTSADRLLKKFQSLSPGFKIPRLNRLQRIKFEKEIEEEVTAEQSNPFARLNSKSLSTANNAAAATAATNGLLNNLSINKTSVSTPNNTLPLKRKFDSTTTNNIDLTPAPKISKEEHRLQFEMNVRLKDYYDTVEKHYGPAVVKQMKLNQRTFPSLNGLLLPYPQLLPGHSLPFMNATTNPLAPIVPPPFVMAQSIPQPTTPMTPQTPHLVAPAPTILSASTMSATIGPTNSSHLLYSGSLQSNGHQPQQPPLHPHQPEQLLTNNISAPAYSSDVRASKQPEPTNTPTLKILANSYIERAHAIDDEHAFSLCDYDEYYTNRDKPLSVEDVIDKKKQPYPGSYYTTPTGETWFVTVTLDRRTQRPRTVILNI